MWHNMLYFTYKSSSFWVILTGLYLLTIVSPVLYAQRLPVGQAGSSIKEDLSFAEKIAEQAPYIKGQGWKACLELAEEFAQLIHDRVTSSELKTQAKFTLIKIKKERARAERDPEKRLVYQNGIIDLLETFIKTLSPNDPNLPFAQSEIGGLYQDKAVALKDDFRKATNPEERQKLKSGAEKAFFSAAEYFKKLVLKYQELIGRTNDPENNESLEDSLVSALYNEALTHYHHAQLYDKVEDKRDELLKETVSLFNTFILTYGQMFIAYDAAIWCGLANYELGDLEQAHGFFEIASSGLVDIIKADPDPKRWFKDAKSIIQKAFYHKAWLNNVQKNYNQAIQAVDELRKIYPGDQSHLMRLALLEKARAYLKLNESTKALEIIQDINGSKTSVGPEIRKAIDEILGELDDKTLPFSVRLTNIRNFAEAGKYSKVIQRAPGLFVDLISAPKADRSKYTPRVLLLLGEALNQQKPSRLFEAAIAYEITYKRYGEVLDDQGEKIGPQSAWLAAEIWFSISEKTGEADDRARYNNTLRYLSDKWSDSTEAKETFYFRAREHEAKKEFAKAAENYAQVSAGSRYYLDALSRVGYMYYLEARAKTWPQYKKETDLPAKNKLKEQTHVLFKKAEDWFANYESYARENKDNPTMPDRIKHKMEVYLADIILFWSRVYLHEAIQKYNRTLELLNDFETKHKDNPTAVAISLALKIEALVNLDDVDQAVSCFGVLTEHCNKNRLMIQSASVQLIALTFESKADKILPSSAPPRSNPEERIAFIKELERSNADKHKGYTDDMDQSMNYLWFWFTMKKKTGVERINPNEVLKVADKLYLSAEELDKRDFYSQAAELYQGLIEKKFAKIRLRLSEGRQSWHLTWLLAQCYTHLGGWAKAVSLLEELEKQRGNDGAVIKAVAIAYQNFACQSNIAQKDKIKYLGEANKRWLQIARGVEEYSQMYWEARYERCHNVFKGGQYQEALDAIESIERQISDDFDDDKFGYRTKFLGLKKQIKEILPK